MKWAHLENGAVEHSRFYWMRNVLVFDMVTHEHVVVAVILLERHRGRHSDRQRDEHTKYFGCEKVPEQLQDIHLKESKIDFLVSI